MLESIRVLEIIQEPIFSALTSQYGSMSRVAAQSSNSAFLLPKLGSMANAYDLLGPRASFKLFKSQKFEQLGGIMKTIRIKDYYGVEQVVPVSDEVYEVWFELQREEDRQRKRISYHHYGVPLDDVLINMAATGPDPVSDEVVRRDEAVRLYEAISKLTPIQRRRVMMLLEDMNCWQIAKAEGRDPSVIYRSVEKSFLRLRILLKG